MAPRLTRGLFLLICGTSLGVLTGIGMRLFERYLIGEIVEVLQDETAAACPCRLEYDSIKISLLRMKAECRGVRMVSEGKTVLQFSRIDVEASLANIMNREILLNRLVLTDGLARGVGEDSATFRFIDQLSTPLPPEKVNPNRLRARLQQLEIHNARFVEELGSFRLIGRDLELKMERDETDHFKLLPRIGRLTLASRNPASSPALQNIDLGEVTGELTIFDAHIAYRNFRQALARSLIALEGASDTARSNLLTGKASGTLELADIPVLPMTTGVVNLEGALTGSLGRPIIPATVTLQNDNRVVIGPEDSPYLVFTDLNGKVEINGAERPPSLSVSALRATGDEKSAEVITPLYIGDSAFRGSISLLVKELPVNQYATVTNLQARIELAGNAAAPVYRVGGTGGLLFAGKIPVDNLNFTLVTEGQDLDFEAWRERSHENGDERLSAHGRVLNFADSERTGQGIQIEFRNVLLTDRASQTSAVIADGIVGLSGVLKSETVEGKGDLTITPVIRRARLPLAAVMDIGKGKMTASAESEDKTLQLSTVIPFDPAARAKLTAKTDNFSIDKLMPALSCVNTSATLDYQFQVGLPFAGSGALDLASLNLGCAPYGLVIPGKTQLPISQGTLALDKLALDSQLSRVSFAGGVSVDRGYQLSARSQLNLESLLGLVRSLDDIEGSLSTDISLRGPLAQPRFSGTVDLKGALFSLEALNIAGSKINGQMMVENNLVSFRRFSGNLNGGEFSIDGSLNPFRQHDSDFVFDLKNIQIDPAEGVSALWSGSFRIGRPDGALPSLKGQIEIHSAEVRRQVDVLTILKSIQDMISSRASQQASLMKVPLDSIDLSVSIPGNFLILSNWASAELSGDLRLSGNPADPAIEGKIETLSGWFGFKSRQFQISSGRLLFSPLSKVPEIDLLSETLVRSHYGDNIFMLLEAKGPIDDPRIRLSSDSGLSERDLLSFLTTGQSPSQQGIFASGGYGFSLEDRPLFDSSRPFSLIEFLRDLTRIDVLTIEPTFNARTGAVEPTFIAQRKLTEDVSLFAQNSFGSGSSDSKAGVSLSVTQALALIGSVESSSTRQNNALAVDLAYTILAAQNPFVSFSFEGNSALGDIEMLRTLRLSQSSRIRQRDLPRLTQLLRNSYQQEGYFNAAVSLQCEMQGEYCKKVTGVFDEGKRTTISGVDLSGEELPAFLRIERIIREVTGEVATRQRADELQQSLVNRLRSEGYLGARISVEYVKAAGEPSARMAVNSSIGKPVTFIFKGNKLFSPRELLETINLFGRRQPFGSNTIAILVDNIERKYREAGYLYATIAYRKENSSESSRITYTITIQEEGRASVSHVDFEGLVVLTRDEIRESLDKTSPLIAERIFHPATIVQEELENNTEVLKNLYVNKGYPGTKVSFELKPDAQGRTVAVLYKVTEGLSQLKNWIVFSGLPADIAAPEIPEQPYTIPDANHLLLSVYESIRNEGYLTPTFRSERIGEGPAPVQIHFTAGPRTFVDVVRLEGLTTIAEQTVREALIIKAGDPWSIDRIDESRRRLLHLGLFSQVEMVPEDGELDSDREALLVRLSERPLTTVSAGVGANSAFGLHLFGETIDRSLLADGRMFSLRFDTYYDQADAEITQGTANLRYLDPEFFSKEYTFTEDLRYQNLQRATQEFNLNRVSLSSSIQRSFSEWPTLSLAHTLLTEELSNVPADSVIGEFDTGSVRLGFFSGSATLDRRDNPFNPSRGYSLSGDFRVASRAFGSEAEYTSVGGNASTIIPLTPLSPRLAFAFHSRLASSWVFGDTEEIPISQRFYLGGRSSVRGFRENSLGPRGENGNIIGGDLLFLGSSEFQYMMYDILSLHFFLDTGNVFLRGSDDGYDVRKSAGVGFRYRSPIGPIGFDLGHPLDERSGEPSVRLHFSVGSNF